MCTRATQPTAESAKNRSRMKQFSKKIVSLCHTNRTKRMRNATKIRAMKALTLLSAYLLATVGTAAASLSCDCRCAHRHSHADKACETVACCCGHDHDEHSADCDIAVQMQFGSKCCNHDHSTSYDLYTAGDDESTAVRSAAAPTDAVADGADRTAAVTAACDNDVAERRCPPAQRCRLRCRPLRAPPVCA